MHSTNLSHVRVAILALALLATVATAACAVSSTVKDVTYFLHRLHTLDHLPELEESHTSLTGSWDRLDANWDAIDYHNLQGTRNIMLDVDGPGCVAKILEGTLNDYGAPQAYGTIEGTDILIYLDNSPTPVFEMPLVQFLDPDKGPFPNPMTWNPRYGHTFPGVVFPIPYAKHCRIELRNPEGKHWGSYWNITYLTYPAGTRVKTFAWPLSAREKSEMDAVCKTWLKAPTAPPDPPKRWSKSKALALRAGESKSLDLFGPAVIREMRMSVTPNTIQALRNIRLQVFWDGAKKPSVDVPLGYLFGNGDYGTDKDAQYSSLLFGVTPDEAYCKYPMPFSKRATVKLTNDSGADAQVSVKLSIERLRSMPADWGFLHATWLEHPTASPDSPRFGRGRPTITQKPPRAEFSLPFDPEADYCRKFVPGHLILERTGRGRFVGVFIYVDWNHPQWWGEGDLLIWSDEKGWPPSYHTTGIEESLNSGWCGFDRKAVSGFVKQVKPDIAIYMFSLIDGCSFQNNIKVGWETMCGAADGEEYMDKEHPPFGSTAFWYADKPLDAGSTQGLLPR